MDSTEGAAVRQRAGIAAVAFGLALALVGAVVQVVMWWPESRDVTDADIVGAWRGAGGAVLTFREDHTFTATSVPFQLAAPGLFDEPWSGAGTWELNPGKLREQFIQLGLENRVGLELERQWKDDRFRLYFWIGDPDEGKRFFFDKA